MSRHLLIAGTGRAGTSFLVRYLTQLGLDTTLSRAGSSAEWDEHANAGLEQLPIETDNDLPYVVKSPWTYLMIHEALASGKLQLDAVLIPMRDLAEAASSRSILELRDIHGKTPWLSKLDQTWEHYGHTPGGIVYSINPVDQARLLAVGFHQLLVELVKADVPIVLLSFPRLIEDADYLHAKLAPVLPDTISAEVALAAHAAIADPSKVRVGAEIGTSDQGFVLNGPSMERLEHVALKRLVGDLRAQLATARGRLDEAATIAAEAHAVRDQDAAHRLAAEEAYAAMALEHNRTTARLQTVMSDAELLRGEAELQKAACQAARDALAAATVERDEGRMALLDAQAEIAQLRTGLAEAENAASWRVRLVARSMNHAASVAWRRIRG